MKKKILACLSSGYGYSILPKSRGIRNSITDNRTSVRIANGSCEKLRLRVTWRTQVPLNWLNERFSVIDGHTFR